VSNSSLPNESKESLHKRSQLYWSNVLTTYLASHEYYDRQEQSLIEILNEFGPFNNSLDLGCGDGRYTKLASKYSNYILGVDINQHLINQAVSTLAPEQRGKIEFQRIRLGDPMSVREQSLVMCLGVLSCIIAADALNQVLRLICNYTERGGCLITKDTLSKKHEIVSKVGDYVAVYREKNEYVNLFVNRGFRQLKEVSLTDLENTSNSIFVFEYIG
jgi:SAM-dependent methyltransferase